MRRLAGLVGGSALLAAWLATAAGTRDSPVSTSPDPASARTPTQTLVADVQAQTERLRERLSGAPAPREPSRNPFTFGSSTRRERPPSRPIVSAELPPALETAAAPDRPAFVLVGVAEKQTPGGLSRIAIISGLDQLFMVSQNELVGSQYRVVAVSADAVELAAVNGGPSLTLGLK